jgi:hypothetical protein
MLARVRKADVCGGEYESLRHDCLTEWIGDAAYVVMCVFYCQPGYPTSINRRRHKLLRRGRRFFREAVAHLMIVILLPYGDAASSG